MDLIVGSEVLYGLPDGQRLASVARRIAAALEPGGPLVMAHPNPRAEEPWAGGVDWPNPSGAKGIAEAFAARPGLRLVESRRSDLSRIEVFRREDARSGPPVTVLPIPHATTVPRR